MYLTRLAPSPTGALHLGNARTFLIAWLRARKLGGRIILRMENLAHPKVKPHTINEIYHDLRWLGLDWDEGDDCSPAGKYAPYTQSQRLPFYRAALEKLLAQNYLYPCDCSRADIISAQSAPHLSEEILYPNFCRDKIPPSQFANLRADEKTAWRMRVPSGEREFHDNFCGVIKGDLSKFSGDFVVARGFSQPAYQLACVVDDAMMNISEVIRGDDLLLSTFRQLALYDALKLSPPEFLHLPLLIGDDGKRLAKRHGDTRLSQFRQQKITPEKIVGYLAYVSGLLEKPQAITLRELLPQFDLPKIKKTPVVIGENIIQCIMTV